MSKLCLADLRPKFTGIKVGEDDYIPSIEGGAENVEIWFDQSGVPLDKLKRINLLVKDAYYLGIKHASDVALAALKEKDNE